MKNILKRLSCLMLVALLVLSFAACSGGDSGSSNTSGNDPKLEKLVNEEGDAFETSFEQSFGASSGGLKCDCKLSVNGTTLIVDCLVEGVNDVPESTRKEMQDAYDKTKDDLSDAFKPFKAQAPALSQVTLNVCEEDGDVIATVLMNF